MYGTVQYIAHQNRVPKNAIRGLEDWSAPGCFLRIHTGKVNNDLSEFRKQRAPRGSSEAETAVAQSRGLQREHSAKAARYHQVGIRQLTPMWLL